MHRGACGRVGNAFPSSPPLEKKNPLRSGTWRGKLLRLETEVGPGGADLMAPLLEQRCTAAGRHGHLPQAARFSTPPLARRSLCLRMRPALARPCRHLPLRRRHAFKASTAAAPGSIPAQADAGRGLLHARALLPAQGLAKVRRPSCHCNLLP